MIILTEPIKKEFKKFLKTDKKSGVKKAWYFTHMEAGCNQAIDTLSQYNDFVKVYENQGIELHKTLNINKTLARKMGVKNVKLHVFRNDDMVLNDAHKLDRVAMSFNYMPASCETCIAEIIL